MSNHEQNRRTFFKTFAASGLVFFRRIAKILGNRLLQSYTMISSAYTTEEVSSFGTGQVQDISADV